MIIGYLNFYLTKGNVKILLSIKTSVVCTCHDNFKVDPSPIKNPQVVFRSSQLMSVFYPVVEGYIVYVQIPQSCFLLEQCL